VSTCSYWRVKQEKWVCPRPEQRPCSSCPAYEACLADAYRFVEKTVGELPR